MVGLRARLSTGPDEEVAALLQPAVHANLFRGDSVGAIAELLRAVDLSPGRYGPAVWRRPLPGRDRDRRSA